MQLSRNGDSADWSVFSADPRHQVEHYGHVERVVQQYVPALGTRIQSLYDELTAKFDLSA
jgi:hypothetical protein